MSELRRPVVLATICARGGSKGLPGKNVRPLLGKPLIAWSVECARACEAVDAIVVSTDSDDIAAAAEAAGVPVPFRRPSELSGDESAKIHAIRHATAYAETVMGVAADLVVDLDVGVPLRLPSDIAAVVDVLATTNSLDAAVTVYESERSPYFNMVEVRDGLARLVKTPETPVIRRQDAPTVFSVTPAVFAFRRSKLDEIVHLYSGTWGVHVMPRERSIDIDDEVDWLLVEALMTQQERSLKGPGKR